MYAFFTTKSKIYTLYFIISIGGGTNNLVTEGIIS